ncbi:MAG: chromosomal replication initiator protein DnaA [Anaerolineae bacterium]|nr:MAG: chromosomal replication initiator protein DnaA [Anaerolineae bacterium]
MQAERLWQAALGQLQVEMPRAKFETWIRDAELLSYEDGEFVVGVRNAFARDWLDDRMRPTIKQVLGGIAGRTVDVRFVVWQPQALSAATVPEQAVRELHNPAAEPAPSLNHLNPKYTFETFVVGKSNRLAHAAALAVTEHPAGPYNPLFLYGGVGLGKTHLLHAITRASLAAGRKAVYVSSEEFTNDLINAIRTHSTSEFRERYRQADILLVDDVQFIAGKESTQEEFFHTFNALHAQERQVVLSSDRPPRAFVTLEERLRSRFEWGLAADIQPPGLETKVAILRAKAEREGRRVSQEHLELIARRAQRNIRELEGALTRALAYSDLAGASLNEETIEAALADVAPRSATMTPDRIISAVAQQYQIPEEDLLGRRRTRQIALPRQVAMYLIREETDTSLPKIGQALGGRDHTTVMYGHDRISDLIERDDGLRRQVHAIRDLLYG